jgi:hypothetical protein
MRDFAVEFDAPVTHFHSALFLGREKRRSPLILLRTSGRFVSAHRALLDQATSGVIHRVRPEKCQKRHERKRPKCNGPCFRPVARRAIECCYRPTTAKPTVWGSKQASAPGRIETEREARTKQFSQDSMKQYRASAARRPSPGRRSPTSRICAAVITIPAAAIDRPNLNH